MVSIKTLFNDYFYIYYVSINLLALGLFKLDKIKAKNRSYRIPEILFFTLGLLGASPGLLFGIVLFKHKISKNSFSNIILLEFLIQQWLFIRRV